MPERVVAISGGASGIGRATALELAQRGAQVGVADLDRERGESVVGEIAHEGGQACFTSVDVTRAGDVERWLAEVVERYGGLDWLFNNAGINGPTATLEDYGLENFEKVVRTDLLSVAYGIHAAIPHMRRRGAGAIVNTGSTASLTGYATLSAYCAAKHGVLGLTRSVARELAKIPIRVNCICPGPIDTPMMREIERGLDAEHPEAIREAFEKTTAMGRYGSPEEIAKLVAYLFSDDAAYVTGAAISIDGGVVAGHG